LPVHGHSPPERRGQSQMTRAAPSTTRAARMTQ
jgi:hypothetical protein